MADLVWAATPDDAGDVWVSVRDRAWGTGAVRQLQGDAAREVAAEPAAMTLLVRELRDELEAATSRARWSR